MKEKFIITIDGPSAAGKSTVSNILAENLGFFYLNTGAMYRVVALEALRKGIDFEQEEELSLLCSKLDISFSQENGNLKVFSYGREVTQEINTPKISLFASKFSSKKVVREALVKLQRKISKNCQNKGVVLEGRDAGTVIFPKAQVKFYLDASLEIRAKRRYKELQEKNIKKGLGEIVKEIEKRDNDDQQRKLAPLRPAPEAIIIDSSSMTIDQVVGKMLRFISLQNPEIKEVI